MRIFLLFTLLFSTQLTFAQGTRQISMDDLWKDNTFRVKDVPGFNAMKDGLHYTQLDKDSTHSYIRVYTLETGMQERTLLDNAIQKFEGKALDIESYTFSKDERKLLLHTEGEHIYRRS